MAVMGAYATALSIDGFYDANGNRDMAGYDIDPNNQLKSDGTYDYTYDEEGNRETRTLLATGYVTRYFWDHRNRLVGVHEFDDNEVHLLSTVTNTYDALNRWIRREVDADGPGGADPVDTFFAWDSLQLALEFTDDDGSAIDGDDLTTVRTYAPNVDHLMAEFANGGDLNFELGDHLNTPRDWVAYDPIGTDTINTGHQIYNAFGHETYTTGFKSFIGFAGRPFEFAVGASFNWHRWYDANTARWLSDDPISFNSKSWNLSSYVSNRATLATDPTGLILYVDGDLLTEQTFNELAKSDIGIEYIKTLQDAAHTYRYSKQELIVAIKFAEAVSAAAHQMDALRKSGKLRFPKLDDPATPELDQEPTVVWGIKLFTINSFTPSRKLGFLLESKNVMDCTESIRFTYVLALYKFLGDDKFDKYYVHLGLHFSSTVQFSISDFN